MYQLKDFSISRILIIALMASLTIACGASDDAGEEHPCRITVSQSILSDTIKDDNESSVADSTLVLIESFLFRDSTELQILTKELTGPEKCHSLVHQ